MAQSCHFKKWGRDISFTSRAAASEGNKNSLWVMKGTIIFPHERLSRNTEDKFPHERRSREWGNLFSVWLLSLEWVNIIVPWMTNREFFLSPFFKMMGLTFLLDYWKLCIEHLIFHQLLCKFGKYIVRIVWQCFYLLVFMSKLHKRQGPPQHGFPGSLEPIDFEKWVPIQEPINFWQNWQINTMKTVNFLLLIRYVTKYWPNLSHFYIN